VSWMITHLVQIWFILFYMLYKSFTKLTVDRLNMQRSSSGAGLLAQIDLGILDKRACRKLALLIRAVDDPHDPFTHDSCSEPDIALDRQLSTLPQRWRAFRKACLEIVDPLVVARVELDQRQTVGFIRTKLVVFIQGVDIRSQAQQIVTGFHRHKAI